MIKKKYVWKELSSDGLLKNPPAHGPYYNRDDRLQDMSFDTEEEAISLLEDYIKVNDLNYYFADMILITIYNKTY
ncbi:MAG: hypothetical protein PHC28_04810 [Flavobacterium sp.]|uniref:hypothetical protein n=1 Tax=Flavobacterium sp. TaxID=239 RepID=UPI00263173C9|nr:hypothetical protein [Flavobacterium sp.]MDD5149786.1 hypothetical protein [Flavobacterium sp.]